MVEAIKTDYRRAPITAAELAMLDFADKLTRSPAQMTEADVEGLRQHGFDDPAIHDIVQVAALFNYYDRLADGLGIDPEPEFDDG
ncbi:MAG: peroxidase [Thermoanaerobaculia bacterium]|nr:peroxidase [Thermoanaerobaculia bacterium]